MMTNCLKRLVFFFVLFHYGTFARKGFASVTRHNRKSDADASLSHAKEPTLRRNFHRRVEGEDSADLAMGEIENYESKDEVDLPPVPGPTGPPTETIILPEKKLIVAPEGTTGVVLENTRLQYGFLENSAAIEQVPNITDFNTLMLHTKLFYSELLTSTFPNFQRFEIEPLSYSHDTDRAAEVLVLFNSYAFFETDTDIPTEETLQETMQMANYTDYIIDYVRGLQEEPLNAFSDVLLVYFRKEGDNPIPLFRMTMEFGFFADTTTYEPTEEEIMDIVLATNLFYSESLMTYFPNLLSFEINDDLVGWLYTETAIEEYPVFVQFSGNATFDTTSGTPVPFSDEVMNAMNAVDYMAYIMEYVWIYAGNTSLFQDTQRVRFGRGF